MLANALLEFCDRFGSLEINLNFCETAIEQVNVRIVEAGHGEPAVEVDAPGLRRIEWLHFVECSRGHNRLAADRQRGDARLRLVPSPDGPVVEDDIGGLFPGFVRCAGHALRGVARRLGHNKPRDQRRSDPGSADRAHAHATKALPQPLP